MSNQNGHPTIEDTILLAAQAHALQTDLAGLPYILHPLRVMSMFVGEAEDDERTVALLHDVVEDTYVTLDDLRLRGYSDAVIEAIEAITWVAVGDESYAHYIARVARNPLASKVKLADLADNLDPRRPSTATLPPAMAERYRNASNYLMRKRSGLQGAAR